MLELLDLFFLKLGQTLSQKQISLYTFISMAAPRTHNIVSAACIFTITGFVLKNNAQTAL